MDQMSKRVRPWTDSLDLNQLKQSFESQSKELSRSNIHLQTLRTKITSLEYKLSDTEKEIESQKFVIDHLQDTIKLFGVNNENQNEMNDGKISKPSTKLIVTTLCKELIKARKCQSTAMIKLRVASQSEIELQETISSRDKRINELKQHLNANKYSMHKGGGQVIDIMKKDRKLDELILEIASKDAEIRHLKKKLSIEQSKVTVIYDIQPLQELVEKIDVYYHHNNNNNNNNYSKAQNITDDVHINLSKKIVNNDVRNKNNDERHMNLERRTNLRQDRLDIGTSKHKLTSLISELNEYIDRIKSSVCNMSFNSKSSQRTALKLKKIEDLCKLQHIKITACSQQINNLLINIMDNTNILDNEYQGLQIAHDKLQQHIAEEKTKYVEMEQELMNIRDTLKHKKYSKQKIDGICRATQTDNITVDFDLKVKIKSLQDTVKSLRKSKNMETQVIV